MTATGSYIFERARGFKTLRLFGICFCLGLFTHAAWAQSDDGMSTVTPLYDSGASADAPAATAPMTALPAADASRAALDVRTSQLETELRTMTGKIEILQHQLQVLQDQKSDVSAKEDVIKLDARVTALEQKQSADPAATAPDTSDTSGAPPQPDAATGSLTQPDKAAFSSSGVNYSSGAHTLGTLSQTNDGATKPTANSPDEAYEQAYGQYKAAQYAAAVKSFQAFLVKYPKHPLAGNAQYWLGESYFSQSQFDKSAKAFALDYQSYPHSPKAPEALLKLGMSLNSLGKATEACLTYAQLKKQFPASTSVLMRADDEAKKAGCKP